MPKLHLRNHPHPNSSLCGRKVGPNNLRDTGLDFEDRECELDLDPEESLWCFRCLIVQMARERRGGPK